MVGINLCGARGYASRGRLGAVGMREGIGRVREASSSSGMEGRVGNRGSDGGRGTVTSSEWSATQLGR
jgi:hypothetical protein